MFVNKAVSKVDSGWGGKYPVVPSPVGAQEVNARYAICKDGIRIHMPCGKKTFRLSQDSTPENNPKTTRYYCKPCEAYAHRHNQEGQQLNVHPDPTGFALAGVKSHLRCIVYVVLHHTGEPLSCTVKHVEKEPEVNSSRANFLGGTTYKKTSRSGRSCHVTRGTGYCMPHVWGRPKPATPKQTGIEDAGITVGKRHIEHNISPQENQRAKRPGTTSRLLECPSRARSSS